MSDRFIVVQGKPLPKLTQEQAAAIHAVLMEAYGVPKCDVAFCISAVVLRDGLVHLETTTNGQNGSKLKEAVVAIGEWVWECGSKYMRPMGN